MSHPGVLHTPSTVPPNVGVVGRKGYAPDTDHRSRRYLKGGSLLRIVAGLLVALSALLLGTTAANAATPPVTYAFSFNSCTTIQNGATTSGLMDLSRPITAAHYSGTTYLYWAAQPQAVVNGVWTNLGSPIAGAYAHIWGYSGTNLTPIYWGDRANNYGVGITARPGHQYRVIGETYWWNGRSWFASDRRVVVMCRF